VFFLFFLAGNVVVAVLISRVNRIGFFDAFLCGMGLRDYQSSLAIRLTYVVTIVGTLALAARSIGWW
jgi:hypothetical protein